MSWLWGSLLIVIAFILAFVGLLASADPEGRGSRIAVMLFVASSVALSLALTLIWVL